MHSYYEKKEIKISITFVTIEICPQHQNFNTSKELKKVEKIKHKEINLIAKLRNNATGVNLKLKGKKLRED